jgi:uncharacterized protein
LDGLTKKAAGENMKTNHPSPELIIAQIKEWLEKAVIGLNLCPFAKAVHLKKQIRYVVSEATDEETLLQDLVLELRHLEKTNANETDTTLLIHPKVLNDFMEYNEFLGLADVAVQRLGLEGVIQVASFHPQYRFAGTTDDDIANYSNRSQYPLLHLLREESVTKAVDAYPDVEKIPDRNIETLTKLGHDGWKKLGIPGASS